MKTYDLYAVDCESLDAARRLVERALSLELAPHESAYRCGDYFLHGRAGSEQVSLQRNYDAADAEWVLPDHQDVPFLRFKRAAGAWRQVSGGTMTDEQCDELLRPFVERRSA